MRTAGLLLAAVGISFAVAATQTAAGTTEVSKVSPPQRNPGVRQQVDAHSTPGWSGVLSIPMGALLDHHLTVTLGFVFDGDDAPSEEYAAYPPRLAARTVETTQFSLRLEFARFCVYATVRWRR